MIFGAPNCHDWWLDSDSGLLQRLLKLLPELLMEYYNNLETEHSRVRFINFLLKTNNITPFQKLWITLPSLLYQSLKQFNTIILALIFYYITDDTFNWLLSDKKAC